MLNSMTVKDKYPLPLQEQLFDQLSGVQYVSSLDLESGCEKVPTSRSERRWLVGKDSFPG